MHTPLSFYFICATPAPLTASLTSRFLPPVPFLIFLSPYFICLFCSISVLLSPSPPQASAWMRFLLSSSLHNCLDKSHIDCTCWLELISLCTVFPPPVWPFPVWWAFFSVHSSGMTILDVFAFRNNVFPMLHHQSKQLTERKKWMYDLEKLVKMCPVRFIVFSPFSRD